MINLKIRVPFKPVLRGLASVAQFINCHERTQLNRVCYFQFFLQIYFDYMRHLKIRLMCTLYPAYVA